MLSCTFQHLKGIATKKEHNLWRNGITSWKDLEILQNKQGYLFKEFANPSKYMPLHLAQEAIEEENTEFFAKKLPRKEYYRIALTFPEKTMFLDIETTGLSKFYDTITIVGWSMGQKYDVFIKGHKYESFREAMLQAKAIVTFNGSLFDIPFILQHFADITIPLCHIDLRFLAKRVGLSGGQKVIENIIGVKRPEDLSSLKSKDAPGLWYKYLWGETPALKKLIAYNHADIEGMKVIFDYVVKRILKENQAPLSTLSIPRFAEHPSKINWATKKSNFAKGIHLQPYSGKWGPNILLRDLSLPADEINFRVVGIDLTGSKARPTGWCVLENDYAVTKRIESDDEIIEETVRSRPALVSIDSPLSLPKGRKDVSDDDPGRKTYGIMRRCERSLKKRGINVYPSLIKSMQRLTARGIRLAHHFRSLGIPVIESYPGAAQDIMGIPRKRASLEFLSKGLKEFGIRGKFIRHPVSHDELDAITSAVVGLFFWSGKFEALGNEDEEYLIIPDININPTAWRKRRVIGFSGPIAAGKTTAGYFLRSKDFHYGRFSQALESLLQDRGIVPSRQTLQEAGEGVNKNQGQRWLCNKLLKMLPDQGDLVIDGLRFPEDHASFVEKFGPAFLNIYIDAPEEVRLRRYVSQGFDKAEFINGISHSVEIKVNKLSTLAHIVIENKNSIKSFEAKIVRSINGANNLSEESLACR